MRVCSGHRMIRKYKQLSGRATGQKRGRKINKQTYEYNFSVMTILIAITNNIVDMLFQ